MTEIVPSYLARSRDDFVKADFATYHHVAMLTPAALLKLGKSPRD